MLKKMQYRFKVLKALLQYSKGVRRFFILNLNLSMISILLEFINPQFYKIFVDDVIIAGHFSKISVVILGYLVVFFMGVFLGYLKNYANYTLVNTILYRVKYKIFQGMFSIPFSHYVHMSVGDMKMRIEDDTNQIENFAYAQSINYLLSYVTLIISAAWLFYIDWRLAIFSMVAIPLTFLLDHIISKRESVLNDINRENNQKMSTWLHASIKNWQEVKALNLELTQKRKFVRFLHNYALYFAKWINFWTTRVLIIPKIKEEFFMRFGLYFCGGFLIIYEHMKISDLLVFAMYYEIFSSAISTVSSADADLQSNMPYTNRLLETLNISYGAIKNGIVPNDSNIIELRDVRFTYSNSEHEVINGINLKINKGERVAITGESGCGKTTLLKLIVGMIEPTSGEVLFSGIPLSEINLDAMHRRIGFVMQENVLFNTTIRKNLLYGKETATQEELCEACKKAYILSFINSLPDGFDTIIGERGVKLSGGQRQRLVLARLFLREVEIFIFDEATSALDQYSESVVHDAIDAIGKDKSIIVVAHRESSVRLCDRKINLSEGMLFES